MFSILTVALLLASPTWAEHYSYAKHGRLIFNSVRLGQCMAGAIGRNGHPTSLEPRPLYSNGLGNEGMSPNCKFSIGGFYSYLGADSNRTCDFVTGQEKNLRAWVEKQKPNSIDPLGIFRESLKLNSGLAFDALLTIHQLLRNEARYFNHDQYHYQSNKTDANKFWDHFVDIRGDLVESGKGNDGDHRGSWYRIWAMMLFRIILTERNLSFDNGQVCQRKERGFLTQSLADFSAAAVAIGEELSKYLIDLDSELPKMGGDRLGKARMNSAGTQTASALIDALKNGSGLEPDSDQCFQDQYLHSAKPY